LPFVARSVAWLAGSPAAQPGHAGPADLPGTLALCYQDLLGLAGKRRNGAKSGPPGAIRAAREALSCTRPGTPRTTGER
jgi:hypothetical protein